MIIQPPIKELINKIAEKHNLPIALTEDIILSQFKLIRDVIVNFDPVNLQEYSEMKILYIGTIKTNIKKSKKVKCVIDEKNNVLGK